MIMTATNNKKRLALGEVVGAAVSYGIHFII